MKRTYYYFLFRIYWYYRDKVKENDATALFSATAVSTTVISINLLTLYFVANYFDWLSVPINKYGVAIFIISAGLANHYFIVKRRKFLNYSFQKDRKRGYYVILYFITTALFAFAIGSYNREKILRTRQEILSKESKQDSLEGKIKEWFKGK